MEQLERPIQMLRLLSRPLRVRILDFLDQAESPQRVTEIVRACKVEASAIISQQLRILKDGGLVESQRDGNQVFYRIISPEVRQYLTCLRASV